MALPRIHLAFVAVAFVFGLALGSGIGIPVGREMIPSAEEGREGDGAGTEAAVTFSGSGGDSSGESRSSTGSGLASGKGSDPSPFALRGDAARDGIGLSDDSPEIISRMRTAIKKNSTSGKLEYLSLLQELTPEEAPHLIALFRKLGQQGYPTPAYDRLYWERWAEIDGAAACETMFERDRRFPETHLSKLVISTWAKEDPVAARDWLARQRDIPLREGMTKGLLDGLAARDPHFAQRFIQDMELTPEQLGYGYRAIARQHSIQGGLGKLGAWYRGFSENDPAFGSATQAVTQIIARAPFADALAWADNLGGSPEVAESTRRGLHDRIANGRPDGLIDHLASDPGAGSLEGVSRLVDRAVNRWISTDPNAMGEWLTRNMDIRNYDLVVAPFAEKIASQDHESALSWANTLRDPELRDAVKERIGSR